MRECLAKLLDNPRRSGPISHVEMQDAPPSVIDREPDVETAEGLVGMVKKSIAAMASR